MAFGSRLLDGVHDRRIEIVAGPVRFLETETMRSQARAAAALRAIKPKPLARAAFSKEISCSCE